VQQLVTSVYGGVRIGRLSSMAASTKLGFSHEGYSPDCVAGEQRGVGRELGGRDLDCWKWWTN